MSKKNKEERQAAHQVFVKRADYKAEKRKAGIITTDHFKAALQFGMRECASTLSARAMMDVRVLSKLANGNFDPTKNQINLVVKAASEMGFTYTPPEKNHI